MSIRCRHVYQIPEQAAASQAGLMQFMCNLRKSYIGHLHSSVTPDGMAELVREIDDYWSKDGGGMPEMANVCPKYAGYFYKYLKSACDTVTIGVPWDCSGYATVIEHHGITVMWMFPGLELERFLNRSELFSSLKRYDYTDQTDCPEQCIADFWNTLFEERGTTGRADLGLNFDFWSSDELLPLARVMHGKYMERLGKTIPGEQND